jgi:hypothetical protein
MDAWARRSMNYSTSIGFAMVGFPTIRGYHTSPNGITFDYHQ